MRQQTREPDVTCQACKVGACVECTDVVRVALGQEPRCPCTRKGHLGEPHGAPGHVCNDICARVVGAPEAVSCNLATGEHVTPHRGCILR